MSISASDLKKKYSVLLIEKIDTVEGPMWRVDVGIRRAWPLHLLDHRPWEKFARRLFPVRTFVGTGMCWHEVVGDNCHMPGKHAEALNALIVEEILKNGTAQILSA